jgi:tetratricopeptide (TPR) repeat protein
MRSRFARPLAWTVLAIALALPAVPGPALGADAGTVGLAFSSDGHYLAVLDGDGALYTCDATTASRPTRLLGTCRGETPAWRPGTHDLAVSLDEGDGWDIWMLGQDGQSTRLTVHPALDCDPQWSASGDVLVFVSDRDGFSRVFQLPIAGEAAARPLVPADTQSQYFPRVQPGGNRVAYVSLGSGEPELWLFTPGGDSERVASLGAWYLLHDPEPPVWDTTGQRLLYVQRDGRHARLSAFDPRTRRSTLLADEGRIERPCLDIGHGELLYEAADGLVLRAMQGAVPARGDDARRVLDWRGLRLTHPALAGDTGLPAAAIEGRGAVVLHNLSLPATPAMLRLSDPLFYAERLVATGHAAEAEIVYVSLESTFGGPTQLAAARLHHVAQLRREGKADQAMAMLERLANTEPPLADPLSLLALQGAMSLFEFRNATAARHTFEEVAGAMRPVPDRVVEAIMFLSVSQQALTNAYIEAHGALRRGNVAESLAAMQRLADAAPASALVRRAILDLLDDPYRDESVQNQPDAFASSACAGAVAEVLEKLERADRVPTGAAGHDLGSLGQRLRHALLDAEVRAGRLAEARETARRILAVEGVDGSSLSDSLRYYLEADRLEPTLHALVGRVLLSQPVLERLEPALISSRTGLVLLLLARLKSALIEGDPGAAEQLLGEGYQAFESAADEGHAAEVAEWKPYIYILAARYQEMRGRWGEAAESYASARLEIVRSCPERGEMVFAIDAAQAIVAPAPPPGPVEDVRRLVPFRMGESADRLRRDLLAAERLTGDPLLWPVGEPTAFEEAATEYRRIARAAEGTPLEAVALLCLGRCLGREGQNKTALECCNRALACEPPATLRLAILLEKAERIGFLGDAWLQANVYDAATRVAPDAAERDFLRLHMADALQRAGQRAEAVALYEELHASAALESQRATAQAELGALREEARPVAKP